MTVPTLADIEDYRFQILQQEVRIGETVVAVRLADKRTDECSGEPVPDAATFAKRPDGAADGMDEMVTKVGQIPSTVPGVHRLKPKLPMAGGWRLLLGAKVQGGTGTVEDKLIVKAAR